MNLAYQDDWLTIYGGDCRTVLAELPDESVHCVVTSPPYWGLRDYGTATWEGGDDDCDHKPDQRPRSERPMGKLQANKRTPVQSAGTIASVDAATPPYRASCGKCGAVRIDSQLGLEPTPEQYVENMVAVFREVRRVLRSDGTVWLNLGDSYAQSAGRKDAPEGRAEEFTRRGKERGYAPGSNFANYGERIGEARSTVVSGLKPKDLVGIPWRVAFALQADGWYLRSDIIWSKPNPMPESVTDRPTKSHEYVFLLAKSPRYYFDADAVRESDGGRPSGNGFTGRQGGSSDRYPDSLTGGGGTREQWTPGGGRNIRTVWTVATQPYPGAHFAVFPEKLIEPCILAGTSERGVCPECGKPWRRVVETTAGDKAATLNPSREAIGHAAIPRPRSSHQPGWRALEAGFSRTLSWIPSCAHDAEPVGATVLDPFGGSGTTARVANRLSRRAVLIDLNPDYLRQQMERNRDIPLGLGA